MSRKRIHPSFNSNQGFQDPLDKPLDDDLSEYECFRKRIKKDNSTYDQQQTGEDHLFPDFAPQNDLHLEINNLYGQEFENLRACSFKTISKIGQQKNYIYNKNQIAQLEDKFSSANGKRRQSFMPLSEEKSNHKETIGKNIIKNSRKQFVSFSSMNEISKMQKRSSLDSGRLNGLMDRMRKRESSFSGIASGSLNSINTQMVNQIIDFTVNDQNELDQIYLNKMVETALIKNVKFSANLYIKFLERKDDQKFYSNVKMYKLLDIDGFSITGFYAEGQKIRINLKKPITNKQFQKKFVFQPQLHSNIQKSKQQSTKQHGVQFQGSFYDHSIQQFEQVKFYFSDIRDNVKNPMINNDEIENINFENWMIPQDSFDCSFAFGNFPAPKNER